MNKPRAFVEWAYSLFSVLLLLSMPFVLVTEYLYMFDEVGIVGILCDTVICLCLTLVLCIDLHVDFVMRHTVDKYGLKVRSYIMYIGFAALAIVAARTIVW